MTDEPIRLTADLRSAGAGAVAPCRIVLDAATLSLAPASGAPLLLQYRDVAGLAVERQAVRIALTDGTSFELSGLGAGLAALVARLREGRTRQRLADRLVQVPADPLEAVEAAWDGWHGLVQLVLHPWGLVLSPFDTARDDLAVRRAEIEAVADDPAGGRVTVSWRGGRFVLLGLGGAVPRTAAAIRALPAAAGGDAAAIVEGLLPTATLALRRRLAGLLVDGRPVSRSELGADWDETRRAFEGAGDMAASLASLAALAGPGGEAWLAVAPATPAAAEPEPKAWFFSAFPGCIAMELATEGAHATYAFATGVSEPAGPAVAGAVATVSEALLDLRFLREPIALPADRLAAGGRHDYRRTVAAIPSLRAARAAFVGRIVHDDGWEAAVRDLLGWIATPGVTGPWPGRAAQEARVAAAGAGDEAAADADPAASLGAVPAPTEP